MAFWLAMLQCVKATAAVLVQYNHLAVNQRIRRQLLTGPGDLWESIGETITIA